MAYTVYSFQIRYINFKFNFNFKTKLVNACCTSFYGAEILDFSHRDIESVSTACMAQGTLANMANSLHNSLGFITALEHYCAVN